MSERVESIWRDQGLKTKRPPQLFPLREIPVEHGRVTRKGGQVGTHRGYAPQHLTNQRRALNNWTITNDRIMGGWDEALPGEVAGPGKATEANLREGTAKALARVLNEAEKRGDRRTISLVKAIAGNPGIMSFVDQLNGGRTAGNFGLFSQEAAANMGFPDVDVTGIRIATDQSQPRTALDRMKVVLHELGHRGSYGLSQRTPNAHAAMGLPAGVDEWSHGPTRAREEAVANFLGSQAREAKGPSWFDKFGPPSYSMDTIAQQTGASSDELYNAYEQAQRTLHGNAVFDEPLKVQQQMFKHLKGKNSPAEIVRPELFDAMQQYVNPRGHAAVSAVDGLALGRQIAREPAGLRQAVAGGADDGLRGLMKVLGSEGLERGAARLGPAGAIAGIAGAALAPTIIKKLGDWF